MIMRIVKRLKFDHLYTDRENDEIIDENIGLALVGTLVPDTTAYHNSAFSRAGHIFQKGLMEGLKNAGLPPSIVISARPIQSFPTSRKLWIGRGEKCSVEEFEISFLSFLNITPFKQIMVGLGTIYQLINWVCKTEYKHRIVYTYNLSVPPGICTLIGSRLIGAKAMVSINDVNEPGQTVPITLLNRLDYFLQRWIIPKFDGHVVVSDQIMKDFAPDKPYIRVAGGISQIVLQKTEQKNENHQITKGLLKIVFAGSLDEANGIRVLLEAFKHLKGDHYRLIIAGSGPLVSIVDHAVEEDPRLQYLGLVPFERVLHLYTESDVLINMRLTQTLNTKYFFPSKVMEFLASGTPVISTCTGHMEEEYGDFCYLLRSETPEALAESIETFSLLDIDKRRKLGREARSYMKKNKTWDAQGYKIRKFIYQSVIGSESNFK